MVGEVTNSVSSTRMGSSTGVLRTFSSVAFFLSSFLRLYFLAVPKTSTTATLGLVYFMALLTLLAMDSGASSTTLDSDLVLFLWTQTYGKS